jgi:hypothetical protein
MFSGLDSLVGLARHGVDVKPTLLRVLTDLYVQTPAHTPDEERQYVELSLRLIDAVDPSTREIVARKLAAYPAAPAAVLDRLQGRRGATAPRPASQPTDEAATRARASARDLVRDFFAADSDGRRTLLQDLDRAGPLAADTPAMPTPSAEVARRLETSVLAGRPGDFVRELERALGIGRGLAERIVNDLGGEPLVVAARALAMPAAVLQRILLFVNPAIGHSVRRVYALSALFSEISPAAALRLASAWRLAEPGEAPRPVRQGAGGSPARGRIPGSERPALPGRATPDRVGSDRSGPERIGPERPGVGGAAGGEPPSGDDPVEKVAS